MKEFVCGSIRPVLLLALLSFAAIAQQAEPRYQDLPNFHQVNEHLYRGGQPEDGGLRKLAELGVKTVINLRGASKQTQTEEAEARTLGMQYFNIPMSSAGRPREEQVSRVLEIIETLKNAPVFVHCRRGSDRTGAIVAIYRIKRDGWTAERALVEAKQYGMGLVQFRKRDYIKDYFEQRQGGVQH
jgi:uncharacterized protein (TIGR01244 family)